MPFGWKFLILRRKVKLQEFRQFAWSRVKWRHFSDTCLQKNATFKNLLETYKPINTFIQHYFPISTLGFQTYNFLLIKSFGITKDAATINPPKLTPAPIHGRSWSVSNCNFIPAGPRLRWLNRMKQSQLKEASYLAKTLLSFQLETTELIASLQIKYK